MAHTCYLSYLADWHRCFSSSRPVWATESSCQPGKVNKSLSQYKMRIDWGHSGHVELATHVKTLSFHCQKLRKGKKRKEAEGCCIKLSTQRFLATCGLTGWVPWHPMQNQAWVHSSGNTAQSQGPRTLNRKMAGTQCGFWIPNPLTGLFSLNTTVKEWQWSHFFLKTGSLYLASDLSWNPLDRPCWTQTQKGVHHHPRPLITSFGELVRLKPHLLLSSEDDIHEVHVLQCTVLCSLDHLQTQPLDLKYFPRLSVTWPTASHRQYHFSSPSSYLVLNPSSVRWQQVFPSPC